VSRRGRNKGRPLTGVLPVNKPVGIGSNELLQRVKRLYDARKAGHTGSLDRLASGVLPLCFGEATKISGFLLDADKAYRSRLRLGVRTNTADAEGEIIEERPVPALGEEMIETVLAQFRGPISQIPPMHSAVKVGGQRLYKLAHKGQTIERQPRPVTIYELGLEGFTQDSLDITVRCSKGTYIRTLGEDIGEMLGCGASVLTLHRTAAGPFKESQSIPLDDLEAAIEAGTADELLLAPELALPEWPRIALDGDMAFYVAKGQAVMVPKAPPHGWVKLFGPGERFIGVGAINDEGMVAPKRLLQA
jgi:tRNA pseudouridine55 synthase